jgi:hypothetical protein
VSFDYPTPSIVAGWRPKALPAHLLFLEMRMGMVLDERLWWASPIVFGPRTLGRT